MKNLYYKFIIPAFFLIYSFPGISQPQTAESWMLNTAQTGTKEYVARNNIILNSGFSYTPSTGNTFVARIDPMLLLPPELNYPDIPDATSSEPETVGSIAGALNVSAGGGAVYSIPIEVPQGVGGMQPNLAIVYNSQSGNGMAGWGCNISGISAITRAPKDIYHDVTAKALTYLADDAYYLDGQRLIYSSGTIGQEGAVYYPESDPFTKITVHGTYNTTTANTWFEVQASNGMKYYYGSTASGRQSYIISGSPTRADMPRILAWYLDYVEDPLGNYMSYSYNNWNNYLYPNVITYGSNKNQAVASQHTVTFGYETRSDITPFVIEGVKGSMDRRLKTVTTKTGDSVYRTYELQYDNTTDGSGTKYSRLTAVTEKNGAGEALKPTNLNWSFMPIFSQSVTQPSVNAASLPAYTTTTSAPQYIACDMDGDGLTDLISMVTVKYEDGSYSSETTDAYIYTDSLDANGNVRFSTNSTYDYSLGTSFKMGDWSNKVGSPCILDFNGDGINDLMVPNISIESSKLFELRFVSIKINDGRKIYDLSVKVGLQNYNEIPLYAASDINNDGKAEIVTMEKAQNSGKYPCCLVGYNLSNINFNLTIPSKPEKMFLSDFNGDGLCDMLIFYSGEYTIFWNQGNGISNTTFSDAKITTGTNIANVWRIWSGDFNGDGLMDFLMSASNDSNWYFALNNGDGTFNKQLACSLGIFDQSFTNRDDPNFDCIIYDFDFDGKSDVVITKAMYQDGILGISDKFVKTYTYWMRSTGSSLVQVSSATSNREGDAGSATYVLGDFNGDGQPELMNYGYNCYSSIDASASATPVWRMYRNNYFTVDKGKITSITGSLGNSTSVTYASLVTGGIYAKGSGSSYPMADYALPLHVVKTVTETNGADGNLITNYQYNGLKAHLQGKGLLGFSSVKANNTTLGTTTESGVKSWNTSFYIPDTTYTKTTVDGKTAETNITMSITNKGFPKYFAYPATQTNKDLDGNTVTTTRKFDTTYGYQTEEKADFGNNMYKTVQYSDYILAGGAYRPQTITRIQKHADDANTFTQKTKIAYDASKGYRKQVIENYGSSLPLTTDYTYDTFGNVKTSKASGSGISPVTGNYDYDVTQRFVEKTYTTPASLVNKFTYDTWGNVLTENNETNPSYILTTKHTYDNWGNRTSTLLPDGSKTTFQTGWNNNAAKRYFTLTQGTGKPWVKTWYDNRGREVLVETIGAKSMKIQTATTYTTKGQVQQKTATTGNITTTETYGYDGRGRVSTYTHSAGQSISYSYGNRTETTTTNGRTYTKTYDAWGDILSSTDPQATINYAYYSLGKPKTVTTGGATFSMEYYDTGTQKILKDPNAGTTTYEYDAAARLIKQTDGRGKITNNVYDAFGRIDTVKTDGIVTKYTYGTSGNEIQRLTKVQTGNNSVAYTHDQLGHITNETRQIDGSETLSFTYAYNSIGQLSITAYPNNVYVYNTYDAYGNLQKLSSGLQTVWELTGETGTVTTEQSGGTLTSTTTLSSQGLLTNLQMTKPGGTIYSTSYVFDGATGNLKSRGSESFLYDNVDRLTTVQTNGSTTMSISYQTNGNIDTKTGLGKYSYSEPLHVHAVTSVENTGNMISGKGQTINYTGFNKVSYMNDTIGTDYYRLDFVYGPDQQRWKTSLKKNNSITKTIIFASDYEKITDNGVTQELYYIGDKAIYVKQAGQPDRIYYAVKDHLGSIVKLVDNNGIAVFEASYDAWGKQTVTNNTFKFHRGYTGHEHLPEFSLINMNGRMYDPVLGRFLSPDPFVQMMDFSQSYNRYSYCLNNPLKYTDPSGELSFFIFPNISWSSDGGWEFGLTGGIGIGGYNIFASVGYGKGSGFTATVGASYMGGYVYAGYNSQAGFIAGVGYGLGMPGIGSFGINSNINSFGINYSSSGGLSYNIGAVQYNNNTGWSADPSVGVSYNMTSGLYGTLDVKDETYQFDSDGNPIPYDSESAYKFMVANDLTDLNSEWRNLYADGTLPPGNDYEYKDGNVVNKKTAEEVLGITKGRGKQYIFWGKQLRSDIYLYPAAFQNPEKLYITIQHELVHVGLYYLGYGNRERHEATAYKVSADQANAWNMFKLRDTWNRNVYSWYDAYDYGRPIRINRPVYPF